MPTTVPDTLRVFTTVGLPVFQFNAAKKQFVTARKVPVPANGRIEDRSFTATVLEAEAVVQITEWFSLTFQAAVQRQESFALRPATTPEG